MPLSPFMNCAAFTLLYHCLHHVDKIPFCRCLIFSVMVCYWLQRDFSPQVIISQSKIYLFLLDFYCQQSTMYPSATICL